MYNYFYTAELNMNYDGMQRLILPSVTFSKTRFQNVMFSSKIFYAEGEVAETVVKDIDVLREQLIKIDCKLIGTDFVVEARCNPAIENKLGVPPTPTSDDPEEAEAEREFWTPDKLALFVLYLNKDEDDYLAQFTIYCYEDEIVLDASNPASYLPNFSTFIN